MRGVPLRLTDEQLEQIRSFYDVGHTLEESATRFGIGYGALHARFKKRGWIHPHGARSRLNGRREFDDVLLVQAKKIWDTLDTTTKGTISENYARTRFAQMGLDVWIPFVSGHVADMALFTPKGVVKIQIKSATYDTATKSFRANLLRHRRGHKTMAYEDGQVDFFAVVCIGMPTLDIYMIPFNAVGSNKSPRLFPHRAKSTVFKTQSWEVYRNAFQSVAYTTAV